MEMHRRRLLSVCGIVWFLCSPMRARTEAPAPRIRLLADATREPADLQRRPAGLEVFEAAREGLSVPAWPTALAIHPDGSRIALADENGRLDLWKWQENRHVRISIGPGYFPGLQFSRDGNTLFSVDGERGFTIRAWDSHTGSLKTTLGSVGGPAIYWAGSPRFWLASDHLVAFLPYALSKAWTELLEHQDDWRKELLRAPILQVIRDGKSVREWSAPGPFNALLFNPQRRFVAVLRDGKTENCVAPLRWNESVGCMAQQHASVELYDLDSGRKIAALEPPVRPFQSWWSPAGTDLLITSRIDPTAKSKRPRESWSSEIWDATTGKKIDSLRGKPANLLFSLLEQSALAAADGKGRWLLFETDSGHVVWDGQTRALIPNLRLKGAAEFLPGTSLVLHAPEGTSESGMTLWDLESRRQVSLAGPPPEQLPRIPPRVAVSASAGLMAAWWLRYSTSGTGGYHVYDLVGDSVIRLWNVHTGELWGTLGGHRAPVRFVEFSADGRLVVTVDAEANVKVWRVQPARAG